LSFSFEPTLHMASRDYSCSRVKCYTPVTEGGSLEGEGTRTQSCVDLFALGQSPLFSLASATNERFAIHFEAQAHCLLPEGFSPRSQSTTQLVTRSTEHAMHSDLPIPNTAGNSIEKEFLQSIVPHLCSIRRRGFTQDMRWRGGFSRILE